LTEPSSGTKSGLQWQRTKLKNETQWSDKWGVEYSTLNKYTYWEDGKRWFKHYDAIRFYVDYHPNRPTALVKDLVGIFRFNRQ